MMFKTLTLYFVLLMSPLSTVYAGDDNQIGNAITDNISSVNASLDAEKSSGMAQRTPSKEMLDAFKNVEQSQVTNLTTKQRVEKYLVSGFLHIVPMGLDHIVFIIALFLSTTVFSTLFWQVTVFTLAHTITLALATIWGISLAASIVEPLIALSIIYVAIENIRTEQTLKRRYLVTFIFGLLHGFGFAFVLSEFGLSNNNLAVSLVSFNVGVELGQLFVIAILMTLFYKWSRAPSYRAFVQLPLSVIVGFLGLFWLLERII
ncbi:HupE/UreJ family protein [Psychrosphaera sp. I2R16]|uniref:HupE/UreJ family protein n=1 Tax=unclassified Psychrosphaera TaxID=2641570 RepID=UPI001C089613|nr:MULTISPECIES: HupE/UreJ family protein [unclassified Psychrosphaera]MBU2884028.1 HupE/UreJ family protein [Psychrosphaera sp. I2R16]